MQLKTKLVNYWLAKQEPSGPRGYNFETLKKDKKTIWDGVHNNLALKHMRNMSTGDLVLFLKQSRGGFVLILSFLSWILAMFFLSMLVPVSKRWFSFWMCLR